jgi:hypothetical protein
VSLVIALAPERRELLNARAVRLEWFTVSSQKRRRRADRAKGESPWMTTRTFVSVEELSQA